MNYTCFLSTRQSRLPMLFQFFSLVFVLFLTRWIWRRWRYDLHKIPSPPSIPLLGHTLDFLFGQAGKQLVNYLRRSLEQLGNPGMIRVSFCRPQSTQFLDRVLVCFLAGPHGQALVNSKGHGFHKVGHVVQDVSFSKRRKHAQLAFSGTRFRRPFHFC